MGAADDGRKAIAERAEGEVNDPAAASGIPGFRINRVLRGKYRWRRRLKRGRVAKRRRSTPGRPQRAPTVLTTAETEAARPRRPGPGRRRARGRTDARGGPHPGSRQGARAGRGEAAGPDHPPLPRGRAPSTGQDSRSREDSDGAEHCRRGADRVVMDAVDDGRESVAAGAGEEKQPEADPWAELVAHRPDKQ